MLPIVRSTNGLPGRLLRVDDLLDAHRRDPLAEEIAVGGVAVSMEVARFVTAGKRLGDLFAWPRINDGIA